MGISALDRLDLISPRQYADRGYPHSAWTRLRRESPVHWFEPEGYKGFWAITRRAEMVEISRQPTLFRSSGRFLIHPEERGTQSNRAPLA